LIRRKGRAMRLALTHTAGRQVPSPLTVVLRYALLLIPALLLISITIQAPEGHRTLLALGSAFELLLCLLVIVGHRGWHPPIGTPAIALHLIGLGWLWFGAGGLNDWFTQLAQSILLTVPLVIFTLQTLTESGAWTYRRACLLAQSLAKRMD